MLDVKKSAFFGQIDACQPGKKETVHFEGY
jgi:hypothetical protein